MTQVHAHRRLGRLYFDREEPALARDHLLKVADLGQRGRDPRPLGPEFWKRLGACDLALHALEEHAGEHPFARDEAAEREEVQPRDRPLVHLRRR